MSLRGYALLKEACVLEEMAWGEEVVADLFARGSTQAGGQVRIVEDLRDGLTGGIEVVRVVETPSTASVRGCRPVRSDHRQERIACANALVENIDEIDTGLDVVNVHKDLLARKARYEPIKNPASKAGRVVPSVAHEYAARSAAVLAHGFHEELSFGLRCQLRCPRALALTRRPGLACGVAVTND